MLTAFAFDDEDDAVEIANGTNYGLTAGIWTRDGSRQMRLARKIVAGQVYINNYGAGGGIELPFGGMKHSGYGREKGFRGLAGLYPIEDRRDPALIDRGRDGEKAVASGAGLFARTASQMMRCIAARARALAPKLGAGRQQCVWEEKLPS